MRHRWDRTDDDLQDLLRIGAYQLLNLDRVPAYAAVQATVAVVKQLKGKRTAGLVNAVLRRVPQEQEPAGLQSDLATQYSHPPWLVDRWLNRFGEERTRALLAHNNTRPTITIRALQWSDEELRGALRAAGIPWSQGAGANTLVVKTGAVSDLPGYTDGAFIVQDPAQAVLLDHADIADGTSVWDACAAPGGKAALLARRCQVLASDALRERMPRLAATLARVASPARLFAADAAAPPFGEESLEAVLLDAPCSATGGMRRHPDARWRLTPERIRRLARQQATMLDAVAPIVRRGGLLVYLTCSLEPEENEMLIDAFLERQVDYRRTTSDKHVFPTDHGTDGGYAARLRRT